MAILLPSGTARTSARISRRALVASGAKILIDDQAELARYRRRSALSYWQERAWIYHTEIPELYFAHNYVRNALSRVRLVPAIESDDPEAPPTPLDDDTTPDGLDPDVCAQILDRLQPWPALMGSIALGLDVPGEAHVALIPDDDEISGERCRVLSNDELRVQDGWYLKEDPNDQHGNKLPVGTELFRLWQPDGRWSALPMSPMRAMLSIADELMLLTQAIRGVARSRVAMNAGLLWISNGLSLESALADGTVSHDDAGDGEGREDPFIEDFMEAVTAAMTDHESAAAALPIIVRGDGNPDELIKHIDIARPLEDTFITIRAELLGRLANGIDLPREIMLGVGGTNHWNAEQIKEQTWHDHLETRALSIVSGITQAFYRPQLLAAKVDPKIARRCTVWYDPSWFLGSPDLAESADYALEHYAIGWETWRRVKGFGEDDKPEQDEIDYRIGIKQRENVRVREQGVAPGGLVESGVEGTPATPTPEVAPPGQDTTKVAVPGTPGTNGAGKPKAMVAAGTHTGLDRLGGRLVNIERDLRTRLLQLADATMTRALERAGMKVTGKLRGRTNGNAMQVMLAQVDGRPVTEVPSILGRAAVISLGIDDEALLAGALGDLEHRYRELVRRAQHAAARAAAQATGDDIDLDELDASTEDHRSAGWLLLAAGLTALAHGLLYDPHPQAPAVGEFDETSLVPPGLVRAALDRAGGANEPEAPPNDDTRPSSGGGAVGGPSMLDEFKAQLGIIDDAYTWVYGDAPRKTFEPHLALDGVTFQSWEDDVLACNEDWPPVDHYQVGDHEGCLCDFEVGWSQEEPVVASVAGSAEADSESPSNEAMSAYPDSVTGSATEVTA